MNDRNKFDLDRPQYNSTLKLIKKLDDFKVDDKQQVHLTDEEIERIHEKASLKLNMRGHVYEGLVSVEPDEEDFLKYLEIKNRPKIKSHSSAKSNQKAPDLMEFYPNDLIKEFPEVEIDAPKPTKFGMIKASANLINDPIEKFFIWN
ncbi:hypothetical protein BpHYR1_032338 [Brachionus plicatilis]|uniref:Protein phosphatase 1 regulatory subunit 35 C-terminal domain-containing protein n=1 Tax=Brachionus plicatilis TaxID=10195 RepID=A0A3M7QAK5_BRAPC|nr:hypothetical protein BpHYR1_032338 [Brachionus plicatilis]